MEEVLWTALAVSFASAGISQGLANVLIEYLRERLRSDERFLSRATRLAGLLLLGTAVLFGVAVGLYYFAEDIVAAALSALSRAGTRGPLLLAAVGTLAGILLFLMRKFARIAYGALEIIIAIIGLAGYPPTAQSGGIPWLISLLALVYILVRGLDNVDCGFKERRERAKTAPAVV
jgi:hypothetical protein